MTEINKELLVIDRFENDFAVCFPVQMQVGAAPCNLPKAEIENDAKAGDVLVYKNGFWRVDAEQTKARRKKILAMQNNLWD